MAASCVLPHEMCLLYVVVGARDTAESSVVQQCSFGLLKLLQEPAGMPGAFKQLRGGDAKDVAMLGFIEAGYELARLFRPHPVGMI